jgi:hypothetical protein
MNKSATKHFITFRKTLDGRPQPLWLEVVVGGSCKRQARETAEAEIALIRAGIEALREQTAAMEREVQVFPDYRFIGTN